MKFLNEKFFVGIILIIGFLVYVNALPNNFVWDDEEQIVNNLVIRDWKNFPLLFISSTFYGGGAGLTGGFYRPLVTLSYFLNYHLWGLNPLGFRFFQITFHLLNLVLIFFILRKIFLDQAIKYSNEISFLATLFFAVHPANVESVIYLGSIGEILYTFFILLAFWFFLENKFYLGFLFAFLGLLSKESAIVIFPLFTLYLCIFVKPKLNTWLSYIAGSAIITSLYLFLRFLVAKIPAISFHLAPIAQASFFERLQTIPYSIFSYFKIIFFPKDLFICRHFVVSSLNDIRFWGVLSFLLIFFTIISFLIWKRKSKLSGFFSLWFFGALFPTLNIFPSDMTIAERWLYFPLIGILALLSFLIFQLKERLTKFGQKILIVFIILILSILATRTIIRNANWRDGLTLYSHDIQYSKNAFDLENNYGVELFRVGKVDEAGEHFKKSIELQPKWHISHNNLGAVLERKGELEAALVQYKKSIELSDYYLAYENIGGILLKMGNYGEAKNFLSEALLKFPNNPTLKWQLALVYLRENDIQTATSLLISAFQDDPGNIKVRQLLEAIQKGIEIEF